MFLCQTSTNKLSQQSSCGARRRRRLRGFLTHTIRHNHEVLPVLHPTFAGNTTNLFMQMVSSRARSTTRAKMYRFQGFWTKYKKCFAKWFVDGFRRISTDFDGPFWEDNFWSRIVRKDNSAILTTLQLLVARKGQLADMLVI